jgi:hypothetical protein
MGILCVDPVLGDRREFEGRLEIEFATGNEHSDLGQEVFRVLDCLKVWDIYRGRNETRSREGL